MVVAHGQEMLELKQETERLRELKEAVALRHAATLREESEERARWLAEQRRAQRLAVELRKLETGDYDPMRGLELRLDCLQDVPQQHCDLQVVLQLFDGPRELMPLQTTAVCPIVYELAAHSGHAPVRRALIETSKFYLKLPPATSTHVVIEVQELLNEGVYTKTVAWSKVPLFFFNRSAGGLELLAGAWRVPLLLPPLAMDAQLGDLRHAPRHPRMALFLRLRANAEEAAEALDVDAGAGPEELPGWAEWAVIPALAPYAPPPNFPEERPKAARARPAQPPAVPQLDIERALAAQGVPQLPTRATAERSAAEGARAPSRMQHFAGIPRAAWCPFAGDPGQVHVARPSDTLLVVLDAARYLPDNAALTQATLSIVDDTGKLVSRASTAMDVCHPDSGTHSPSFLLSALLDVSEIPPRAWVVCKFEAIDVYTSHPFLVGHAVHPLFRTHRGELLSEWEALAYAGALAEHRALLAAGPTPAGAERQTAPTAEPPRIYVPLGGLQVPVRTVAGTQQERPGAAPLDLNFLPRIPCCSALLRVYLNPAEEDVSRAVGLAGIAAKLGDIDRQAALQPRARRRRSDGEESEPDSVDEFTALRARVLRLVAAKPRYETGFYDSTGCEPVGNERATFKRRLARQRQDVSAKDMLVSLLPRAEWDKVRRATDEQAALGALRALMERARGRPRLLPHNTMLHFCTYSPEVGFRVAVDGANNLPCRKNVFPVVVFGATPPCCYFGPTRLTLDTFLSSDLDPKSTVRCPRWLDSYQDFKGVQCRGTRTGLVVQVVGIERRRSKDGGYEVQRHDIGWAAMPLFLGKQLDYLWDGGFQLPLYKGPVPTGFPEALDADGVEPAMQAMEADKKEKCRLIPGCSVMLRVQDLQRGRTSNPLVAQRVISGRSNGIPPDCRMNFLEQWTSPTPGARGGPAAGPRPRMSASDKMKYTQVQRPLAGGLLGGGYADQAVDQLIGPDISWFNWIIELREDAESITRITTASNTDADEQPPTRTSKGVLAMM